MKKLSAIAAISGLLLAPFSLPSAHAATAGSGACAITVTSATGVVVVNSGSFCYVAFTATGSNAFTVPAGVTAPDILIIGGGGAGGVYAFAGGGGAGEVALATGYSVTPSSSISISVGAGGTSDGSSTNGISQSGSNSWVGSSTTLAANGGGAGTSFSQSAVFSGGSGGGGAEKTSTTQGGLGAGGASVKSTFGTATRYGNAGGGVPPSIGQAGGGGGGAGAAGGAAIAQGRPGSGGSGTNAVSTWLSALSSGMTSITGWVTATSGGFIAGGGGGGGNSPSYLGAGGAGGGGKSGGENSLASGFPGIANTGGGGGGAAYVGSPYPGGAGGAGLVVVRYSNDLTPPTFPSAETFNTPENATSVGVIAASKAATITIFGGEDQSKFSIAPLTETSTTLSFISAPNFESPTDVGSNNTYIVVFRAVDGSANAALETVTVTVTNVNEAPSITINSSAATHSLSINEGISSVLNYTASDSDTAPTLTWSISGVDASKYTINSSTGALGFLIAPDFEDATDNGNNNTYTVVIAVSDGSLSDTQTLTVTIIDINEPGLVTAPTLSGTPLKGVAVLLSVTTNTPGKVRFFVEGKRIPNCLARATTGSSPTYTATCSWKPAIHGLQQITAQFTPTNASFSPSTSVITSVGVFRKITLR